jgi:hypothetical protein
MMPSFPGPGLRPLIQESGPPIENGMAGHCYAEFLLQRYTSL